MPACAGMDGTRRRCVSQRRGLQGRVAPPRGAAKRRQPQAWGSLDPPRVRDRGSQDLSFSHSSHTQRLKRVSSAVARRPRGVVAASNATRSAPSATANASPSKAGACLIRRAASARFTGTIRWCWGRGLDGPGGSPFMDMQLAPVYADDAPGGGGVAINRWRQQNLRKCTAKAVAGPLASAISAVGNVAYNERDVAVVQARGNGFVEKLYVRAPLDPVRKGQPLAELYVPEWVAAQEEYLAAKRLRTDVDALALGGLANAAAQRMRLAGMSEDQDGRHPGALAAAVHDHLADQWGWGGNFRLRRHDDRCRRTAVSSQWAVDGVGERRNARGGCGRGASRQRRRGAHACAPRVRIQGTRECDPARGQRDHANACWRASSLRTPAAASSWACTRPSISLQRVEATSCWCRAKPCDPDGKRTVVIVAQGDRALRAGGDVATGIESNGQTEIRQGC